VRQSFDFDPPEEHCPGEIHGWRQQGLHSHHLVESLATDGEDSRGFGGTDQIL
jgi:hypothetical protein